MDPILNEIVRTSALLAREKSFKGLVSVVTEQAQDITASHVGAFYLSTENTKGPQTRLFFQRGRFSLPENLEESSELLPFLQECPEAVVLEERSAGSPSPFNALFLHPQMQSGIILPLETPARRIGYLVLNSCEREFYNHSRYSFLTSLAQLATGMLDNARLLKEMKDYLKTIEDLERYQENIFSSMTNLLVTINAKGKIEYFNSRAAEGFGLTEEHRGTAFDKHFTSLLGKKILTKVAKANQEGAEVAGLEGICKTPGEDGGIQEMDYSLNITPLEGKRGAREGLTLLFTDQSRERALQEQMETVTEERRAIKNMFSRYLSREVVQNLMEAPDLVKPGGDEKQATVFFADIRGYTSFSEGKDPKYIIEILNEYFSEAVEIVIRYGGYIDKFIGDCIMAAWGVPIVAEEEDANKAVACAVEIQQIVASTKRHFFKGEADHLKIGIGMHTGPLVAGNLGSSRRMDYSVIGDTVNVAARLEGVAGPDEIIITEDTRQYLKDQFVIEDRPPVSLKGKAKPVPIFNVKGIR